MFKSGLTLFFVFIAICAFAQNGKATAASPTDLAAIEKLEHTDAAAAKINDVDALTNLWTDDGVLIQPMAIPVIGKNAIHTLLEQQKLASSKVETLSYAENWQEREIRGDRAFEWGTISVTIRLPNTNQITQKVYAFRYLNRNADGSWKFARVAISPAPRQ